MDLYARKIVGWSLASQMRASLVCCALNMAVTTRQPVAGLIAHTDQGGQYASDDYLALLTKYQITASISARGNCYNNAVMERFFLNLKMERVWQTHQANNQKAVKDISQYIVAFNNGTRLHSSLGYLSPKQFETKLTEKPIMSIESPILVDQYKSIFIGIDSSQFLAGCISFCHLAEYYA